MTKTIELQVDVAIPVPPRKRGELTAHRRSLPALTGIRFFAAMYVVLYHSHLADALSRHHSLAWAGAMIRNGLLAVPLFFILSGFILSYTYEGQIEKPADFRRFWEARFARIWPLYAVSLLLSSIFNHTTPHSLYAAICTLFMVQDWDPFHPGVAGSWNFVAWTLSTEALFYLIFPWVQRWLERCKLWIPLGVLVASISAAVAGATGSINFVNQPPIHGIPVAVAHIPEFLIGVCLGNLYLRRSVRVFTADPSASILPGRGALTYFAATASLWLLCQPLHGLAVWTALSFGALLFGLAAEDSALRWLLSTRALLIGGQISYGIYLLQWPCRAAVSAICDRLNIASMPTRFVLDLAALLLLSTAGFYFVEEPARKLLRAFFVGSRARANAKAHA